jgi:hypothetical protein
MLECRNSAPRFGFLNYFDSKSEMESEMKVVKEKAVSIWEEKEWTIREADQS